MKNDPAIIKANNQIEEGYRKAIVKLHMESLSDYETLSKEMFEHIKKVEGKVIAEEGLNIGESEINTKNTDIIESDPVKPVKDKKDSQMISKRKPLKRYTPP